MNDVKYMFPDRRMAYPQPNRAFWRGFAACTVCFAWGALTVWFWLGVSA